MEENDQFLVYLGHKNDALHAYKIPYDVLISESVFQHPFKTYKSDSVDLCKPICDSLLNGKWMRYVFANNSLILKQEKTIKNNLLCGYVKSYYNNGNVFRLTNYFEGYYIDTALTYSIEGNILSQKYYSGELNNYNSLVEYELFDNEGCIYVMYNYYAKLLIKYNLETNRIWWINNYSSRNSYIQTIFTNNGDILEKKVFSNSEE